MKKKIKTWIREKLKINKINTIDSKFLKSIKKNQKINLNKKALVNLFFLKKKKFQISKLKKFCLETGKYKKINNNFNLNTRILLREFNLNNNQNFIKK